MLQRILYIRLIQFWRIAKELGIIRILFIALIATVLLLYFYRALSQNPNKSIVLCCVFTAIIHSLRKDKKFVAAIFEHPYLVYFTEYFVYALPLLVLVASATNLFYLILSLVGMFLISNVNIYNHKSSTTSMSPFSRLAAKENFEWIAGFRATGIFILILWILALCLSFVPYASLVFIWIILLTIAAFYEVNEPLNLLIINEYGAKKFIKNKLSLHIKDYLKMIAPIIILHGIINYKLWYLTLCFFVVNVICFTTIITSKYASYKPAIHMKTDIITVMIVLLSNMFLPLLIFTIPFGIICYGQAISNLNFYLNDFD
ncbi:MAG: hypothetical protein LBQ28_04075 [Prevotellaceae bacterium]|jgi:hypothetical protein|nr:hypothetical protein [Prevotellaceae bacterium]